MGGEGDQQARKNQRPPLKEPEQTKQLAENDQQTNSGDGRHQPAGLFVPLRQQVATQADRGVSECAYEQQHLRDAEEVACRTHPDLPGAGILSG